MIGRSAGVAEKIKVSHSLFETDPKTRMDGPVKMTGREGVERGMGGRERGLGLSSSISPPSGDALRRLS